MGWLSDVGDFITGGDGKLDFGDLVGIGVAVGGAVTGNPYLAAAGAGMQYSNMQKGKAAAQARDAEDAYNRDLEAARGKEAIYSINANNRALMNMSDTPQLSEEETMGQHNKESMEWMNKVAGVNQRMADRQSRADAKRHRFDRTIDRMVAARENYQTQQNLLKEQEARDIALHGESGMIKTRV